MACFRALLAMVGLFLTVADLDLEGVPGKGHKHDYSTAPHATFEPLSADVLANSQVLKQYHAYYHQLTNDAMGASDVDKPHHKGHHKGGKHHANTGTSASFFVHAGLLLGFIFAMIFVYSQNHEKIEACTGLKLTHVCCIVYASLSISIDLSIKNAAETYGGHFPFNPACGVVVVEYAKFFVSLILFALYVADARRSGREVAMPRPIDVAWLAVPAGIYALNNLLVFQAIKSTPLSTFGVVRETMLIWNALIWTATFRQSICAVRWLAIGGIFLGCCANQIPKMLNDQFTPGVFWALLLAFSNAAGAVANEYAMKQRAQLDINLQNCILYTLCGSFVLIGLAICEPATVQSAGSFFTGFVPECWQVIILQVFTGLAVSRILKYVEAVTKTIVAAIRGPGVIFFGAFLFHTTLGLSEVLATVVVCISCYIYLRQGPLVKPPEVPKTAQETDALLQKKTAV